jgi:hypothetical protein
MAIIKQTTMKLGARAEFHRVKAVQLTDAPGGIKVAAIVHSWAVQLDHDQGLPPLQMEPHQVSVSSPSEDFFAAAEAALVVADGPLSGGDIIQIAPATELDAARLRRLSELKLKRNEVEQGGFVWDGSRFDSDIASQVKILGAVQLAAAVGEDFELSWTLADNTVRTLDFVDMTGVGLAMGGHITQTHTTWREVRAAVMAAGSAQDVDAVSWPS